MANQDPDDVGLGFAALVERMRNPFPGLGAAVYRLVRVDGRAVGFVYLRLPEDENRHMALVDVVIHPDWRRRGIGTAVLRGLLPELVGLDRRTVEGWLVVAGSPGDLWAKSLGFRTVRSVARMELRFADADRALWEVVPPDGYRVVRWAGAAPESLVGSYASARSAIHDAPSGQTEFRQPEWTVARVRESEARALEQGVDQRVVVALSGDTVVGLTEVVMLPDRKGEYFQGDTAVLAAHRGRRIGLWLKGEMARWLTAEDPGLTRVTTATESDNHHMIRVNREMGFRLSSTELVVAHHVAELAL